jgi:16S rRNA (cytosine967-C5)-methyltransferase
VRRHPDVPWTKAPEDIAKLADLQSRLLASAVPMVKPGGRIVFSNCSLDPVEGELLVAAFVAEHPDVVLDPVRHGELPGADSFVAQNGAIRTTPADLNLGRPAISGLDGFFTARFLRLR